MDDFKLTDMGLIDISATPLAKDHPTSYIKVFDDVFTPSECASLISLAESDQKWEPAAISTSMGDEIDLDYRNNDRILRFDKTTANMIYQRLLPLVQELVEIKPGGKWEGIIGARGRVTNTWKLVGINERLSFLRYGPDNFFAPHYDGQIALPDGREARVTLQIYLNADGLSGGATRILGKRNRHLDIHPKVGRVLIFEQGRVFHSGEVVTAGLKYALRSDFMFKKVSK